jgi:uncharacterized protein (TIGR00297 family)
VAQIKLNWQSKLVLLLVLPFAGADLVIQAHGWAEFYWPVAVSTLGLSLIFGLVVLKLRAATPAATFAGAAITGCLIFSTSAFTPAGIFPYPPWHSALSPLLAVVCLTVLSTRMGRKRKELLGTAERRQGRTAAQVAANLGVAAISSSGLAQSWLIESGWIRAAAYAPAILLTLPLAALAEAAADTVSSEIGQVLGGQPRMITTLRRVEPGTDGGVSLIGTLAGMAAAGIVAAVGAWALGGGATFFWVSTAGGVLGLFVDSLLGATLERRGWLNNDAVNFLSTASAALFALGVIALRSH